MLRRKRSAADSTRSSPTRRRKWRRLAAPARAARAAARATRADGEPLLPFFAIPCTTYMRVRTPTPVGAAAAGGAPAAGTPPGGAPAGGAVAAARLLAAHPRRRRRDGCGHRERHQLRGRERLGERHRVARARPRVRRPGFLRLFVGIDRRTHLDSSDHVLVLQQETVRRRRGARCKRHRVDGQVIHGIRSRSRGALRRHLELQVPRVGQPPGDDRLRRLGRHAERGERRTLLAARRGAGDEQRRERFGRAEGLQSGKVYKM